jgi:NAD(P)H-flavin reductase
VPNDPDGAVLTAARTGIDAMRPRPFMVLASLVESAGTVTLSLGPVAGARLAFEPGQFVMIGLLGVGEVPISISGDPDESPLRLTIRDVGGVTAVLARAQVGDVLEVRGPYGTGWHVEEARGGDVIVVAGGIGLAPLRPVMMRLARERERYGDVSLVYGARTPADLLYPDDLAAWRDRGIEVLTIVDHATDTWHGHVGVVPTLVSKADIDPAGALALVCGPETMMRFSVNALLDSGVSPDRIRLSMERSMKCGLGLCGHCQLRELFVCTDGPVFTYATIAPLLGIREV